MKNKFLIGIIALGSGLVAPGPVGAAFLDFSVPAREAALGGNGVALPEGTSSLIFNPAGLADEPRFAVSARYENLFSGLEGDNLSTGNLSGVFPLWQGDAVGISVDHFGSNQLAQDRILAAFGKGFGVKSPFPGLRIGLGLSYLRQQFTLPAPLAGVNPSNVSSGNFSVGGGVLYDPLSWATLGISVQDLNQPNLGVVGVDTVPVLFRSGFAVRPPVGEDRLALTFAQSLSSDALSAQGGAEWVFTRLGVALRAGGDSNMGAVGLGWRTEGLSIDYAYQFSWIESPSLGGVGLPGSHLLEIGFQWDNGSREGKVFEALMARGQEAWKAQKWELSLQCYGTALLMRPNDPAALQGRERSLGFYNRQRAEIYYNQGRKAEDRGYFLEAQRDYEWASYLQPGEERYSASMEQIKKSLAQGGALSNPKVQDLLEKAVKALRKGGNRTALKDIKEARRLYPKDAFLSYLTRTFSEKDYATLAPKDKEVQRLAVEAEIYQNKGREDLASATWKKILEKDPGNAMAQENLEEGEGVSTSSGLSDSDRTRSRALLQKGLKAYANGNAKEAVEDWEEVLKIDPHNVNALNNLTRLKMEEGGSQP